MQTEHIPVAVGSVSISPTDTLLTLVAVALAVFLAAMFRREFGTYAVALGLAGLLLVSHGT